MTDWNAIAVQATITGGRPGPTGVLDIAMVQAAVYDAVQAIERRYEPYYVEIPGASGSSVAAAAKAAHDVLVHLFPAPTQVAQLDTAYQQYLLLHGLSETDPGVAVGATAAAGIIALRAGDGSFPTPAPTPFTGGAEPGVWRPTPPNNLPMAVSWLGAVTPFTLKEPSQFRAAPPPPLNSGRYARDYDEVKAIGARTGSSRTPEQTDIAHFWAGNTPVIWNRALRDIAEAHVDNIADSSRLFALTSMAIADALITAWNDKLHYAFWRPITAIREGDHDGNDRTHGDPLWESLITTPNYPDYTSGAVNFATATTHVLAFFFGTDDFTFSVTTTNTVPTVADTRTYERFSDVAEELVEARIYSGIHFRFADEAAHKQGKQVAMWAFNHYMRPR
ncbi:MAG TPA: vanadium-dependent haloperoxidase [Pyrinomonadaceae bacterium]